jgi:hypothetical protein
MQTDSHPYRKLESVLASRQQVLRMEFVAKVRTDRTVQQAGTEGGGGHAACRQAGMETEVNERTKKQTGRHAYRFTSL